MMSVLCIIIGILVLIIFFLLIKILLMQKTAKEISEAFAERLTTDTNTLIDISSGDRYMRNLANAINAQLRKLRRKHLRFEQGDVELKTAITNISHDLRTPLTAICGYLELLKREEKSVNIERCLEIIENRTETLKQLTEELFRYSLILSQDDGMKNEEVCVNTVLEESIAAYYGALKEKNITPTVALTDKKIVRDLDKTALSRIFGNILSNALKYSDGDLEIRLSDLGITTFSNTAAGLDEIQVARLFDRFYTVEDARTSTGLGLSIARNLAERMNGEMSASYDGSKLTVSVNFL